MPRSRVPCLLALLVAAVLTAGLRGLHDTRVADRRERPTGAVWWTADPDSQYHVRPVARLLDEGPPVAPVDPYLDHPRGSAIPWPPYYTRIAGALLGPFAPERAEARRVWVEKAVCSLPALFAALAAVGAALAARRLGGRAGAALVAGAGFALTGASVQYGALGNGDHHAFVSCLTVWILVAVSAGLERPDGARRGALLGLTGGALAGLLLGTWVGGLMYVVLVQAALGLALCAHARRPRPALPPFGLAFHVAALAAVLPAVLASPWRADDPWMVVNLSWFHAVQLGLGALVFAPLPVLDPRGALARRWPAVVGLALAGAAAFSLALDVGPARGLRESFAWAGRANEFMAAIIESQPLFEPGEGLGPAVGALGLALFALPFAWLAALVRAARDRDARFLPWLVATPVMLVQALLQRRFGDALAAPMAVLVGWALAELPRARGGPLARLGRLPAPLLAVLGLAAAAALHPVVARDSARLLGRADPWPRGAHVELQRSLRRQLDWLRTWPGARPGAVLASWDLGHAIEWGADRPTVATNFGSYVGGDGWLDPWRFFLADDPRAAEALLERRDARYVLITADWSRDVGTAAHVLRDELGGAMVAQTPSGRLYTARFYDTLAARLLFLGRHVEPERLTDVGPGLDFLRLVHVTPRSARKVVVPHGPGPYPVSLLWERVPGARLVARGAPGERLTAELELVPGHRGAAPFRWTGVAAAGPDGRATLRVPWATDVPNGTVVARGPLRWHLGGRSGTVAVAERAVLAGAELAIVSDE